MQIEFNNNTVFSISKKSVKPYVNDALNNIRYMDVKNITDLICNQYIDYELVCCKKFLELFLTQVAYIFDRSLYLNENLDTLYIHSPEDNLDNRAVKDIFETFGTYISTHNLSYIEQYLVVQFNLFLHFICFESNVLVMWDKKYSIFKDNEKYKFNIALVEINSEMNINSWIDFLQVKIQQPILLINPDLLNQDNRSTSSTSYLFRQTNDENIEFMYEIGKRIIPNFDIYSENGFTILEYLIHFLTIRGNPLDRWYTLYCGMKDRSKFKPRKHGYNNVIKFEEKYSKLVQDNKIKSDYITLYFSFDHGS